ncbi:MAG: 3-oxoadipate enol-lactonase 2 [Betaproteobacteria bacterium ADurb.Bin341]|nr:MAG: 3-oxoadipate enol-lactonase 2 [Betaproteobacteria bacterium ADurb.Bin341]
MPKINVRDVALYYEIQGKGPETLVFLNGVGMTAPLWKPMVDHFLPQYRCLCHDFRGQLMSDKPEGPYSMEMHVADTLALLDALGIDQAHLIGTSYGSEVAAIFAYTHPQRTRSLTMITGVSEMDAVLRTAVESWATVALSGDSTAFYKSLLPWSYSAEFLESHRDFLEARCREFAQVPKEFFKAFARLVGAFVQINYTHRLKDITCPALIIAAEKDLIKPPRYSELLHREIKHSRYHVVPGSGHAVVVEDPDSLNRLLEDFLRSL